MKTTKSSYEYVIIGSGFGGSFAAYALAKAGKQVLVIERGVWAKRDDTCWDEYALHLQQKPLYRGHTPYSVDQHGTLEYDWPDDTVGGMSTFYVPQHSECAMKTLKDRQHLILIRAMQSWHGHLGTIH
jgi:choline dehydrogenase-like flavoprotein